jgi:hypothetical protein
MITVRRKKKDGTIKEFQRRKPASVLIYRNIGLEMNSIWGLRTLLKMYGIPRRYELSDKAKGFQKCKRTKRSRKVPEGEDPEERCRADMIVRIRAHPQYKADIASTEVPKTINSYPRPDGVWIDGDPKPKVPNSTGRPHKKKRTEDQQDSTTTSTDTNMDQLPARETWETIAKRIEEFGLELRDVTGDGNCMFASLALEMNKRFHGKETPESIRDKICNYISDHSQDRLPNEMTWQEALTDNGTSLEELRKDKTWGNELCLQAYANLMPCRIIIFRGLQAPTGIGNIHQGEWFYNEKLPTTDTPPTLVFWLALIENNHYRAVLCKKDQVQHSQKYKFLREKHRTHLDT